MAMWAAVALLLGSGWRARLRRMVARVRGALAAFPDSRRYVGDVDEAGLPHGHGVMIWRSGARFVGYWNGGLPHGEGVMTWEDGMGYAGTWRDGLPRGAGVETLPDGTRFPVKYKGSTRTAFRPDRLSSGPSGF